MKIIASNRIEEGMQAWQATEQRLKTIFGPSLARNRAFQLEKLNHLDKVLRDNSTNLNLEERMMRRILRDQRADLEKQLYPRHNILTRLLLRSVRYVAAGYRQAMAEYNQPLAVSPNAYNQKSAREVESAVKKMDLGLEKGINEQMKEGKKNITHQTNKQMNENDMMTYTVKVDKNDDGRYAFTYSASLRQKDKPNEIRTYTFSEKEAKEFSATQAYNLLAGRAVRSAYSANAAKSDAGRYSWLQLDLNDKDSTGKYKMNEHSFESVTKGVKSQVEQLPLKDNSSKEIRRIMTGLLNGNQEKAELLQDGKARTILLEVNPGQSNLKFKERGKEVSFRNVTGTNVVKLPFTKQAKQKNGKKNGMTVS